MAGGIRVRQYMLSIVDLCVDKMTGEVNATELAEVAADHFNGYGSPPNYDIPDEYFEWAEEIATAHEIKTGIRPGRIGNAASGLINSVNSDFTINK